MTEEEQQQLRRLEVDAERLVRGLTKAGKTDGPEIDYALAVARVVEFRREHGDTGVMGVRRTRYKIGAG